MNSRQHTDILEEVELLDTAGADKLRLRFAGPFEGETVCWEATLYTPHAWAKAYGVEEPKKNIIEISQQSLAPQPIHICLQVKRIDRPTVRKAVTMVRQYKRLQRGRHQYG